MARPSSVSVLALAMAPLLGNAASQMSIEDRLRALEERQQQLEQALRERDARIEQLEAERRPAAATPAPAPPPTIEPATPATRVADESGPSLWGAYEPGRGFVLVRTDLGELDFAIFSYARYLNQLELEDTYTDAFGRTRDLDLRQDVQLQKITLNFKGWLFDPNFRYLFYAWTSNTSQGLGSQVVLGGNVNYTFNKHFNVGAGIASLPSTRSTNWTFPNWLKIDNRTMADEFFRGSFTTGVFASGEIAPRLKYRVMLGNNLSQLGVDAGQMDDELNTFSGALWWMPTTGEYGVADGFGDYDWHQDAATMFGVNYTRSREDAQSQPGTDSFENSQIRLSDGTLIFSADPFGTGGRIDKATYQMLSANAGVKYRGLSLEAEYYYRKVNDFRFTGVLPRTELTDRGFQLQASAMLIPQVLQLYASGSQIYGQYGDPWDVALGANWYPLDRREVRVNAQFLYLDRSAVGYAAVPYVVGGDGWVMSTDLVVAF
jgi:hypothetical protein